MNVPITVNTSRGKRPSIVVPPNARPIQQVIINRLKKLVARGYSSCLCKGFKSEYVRILGLFEKYQHTVIQAGPHTPSCKKGCGICCYHYAEDVYSFEVEIIAEHLRMHRENEIPTIIKVLESDEIWRARIKSAVTRAMGKSRYARGLKDSDPYDIVLSGFYQLKRPCPLLDKDGSCSIYSVRPLTCRIYVSFSHPRYCKPENINEGKAATYLLDLEKGASDLFDALHFMYDEAQGDTGLRSMLLKRLRLPSTRYFMGRKEEP